MMSSVGLTAATSYDTHVTVPSRGRTRCSTSHRIGYWTPLTTSGDTIDDVSGDQRLQVRQSSTTTSTSVDGYLPNSFYTAAKSFRRAAASPLAQVGLDTNDDKNNAGKRAGNEEIGISTTSGAAERMYDIQYTKYGVYTQVC